MFKLQFHLRFFKKVKKIIKKDKKIKNKINNTLKALEQSPTDQKLKSHKITSKNGNRLFSSRVNGDLRIIWNYNKDKA